MNTDAHEKGQDEQDGGGRSASRKGREEDRKATTDGHGCTRINGVAWRTGGGVLDGVAASRGRLTLRWGCGRPPVEGALDFQSQPAKTPRVACVEIEHLSKAFRGPNGETIHAVRDCSLKVEDKELLVLLGPSGCGKTTTLRLVAGLEEPDGGTIAFDGGNVIGVPPKRRDVAMVFQHHALYPHLSAYENMAFGLKVRSRPRAEIVERVGEAAELLGLTDCLKRMPHELSGGQRQRVALGRAIVRRPKVFLFDEPLSNLDAPMRAAMRAEISKLHQRLGATMIYVTHDQLEAMALGQRIAVMKEGVLQQVATPLELYRRPANLFVAGFIGSPPMNLFHGRLVKQSGGITFQQQSSDGAPVAGGLELDLPSQRMAGLANFAGKTVVLGLRPEELSELKHGSEASCHEKLEAVVELIEPVGAEVLLHLKIGGDSFISRVALDRAPGKGEKILLGFEPGRARFFDASTGKAIRGGDGSSPSA